MIIPGRAVLWGVGTTVPPARWGHSPDAFPLPGPQLGPPDSSPSADAPEECER